MRSHFYLVVSTKSKIYGFILYFSLWIETYFSSIIFAAGNHQNTVRSKWRIATRTPTDNTAIKIYLWNIYNLSVNHDSVSVKKCTFSAQTRIKFSFMRSLCNTKIRLINEENRFRFSCQRKKTPSAKREIPLERLKPCSSSLLTALLRLCSLRMGHWTWTHRSRLNMLEMLMAVCLRYHISRIKMKRTRCSGKFCSFNSALRNNKTFVGLSRCTQLNRERERVRECETEHENGRICGSDLFL